MLINDLKRAYLANRDRDAFYVRNCLKEVIQFYTLNYIFNSKWGKNLIFKGGTCLRFCFDLPRLSEDLDFDIENDSSFEIEEFLRDLESYFLKTLQFSEFETKLAGNKRTIYLKFPVLAEIGMPLKAGESKLLHVRIDLAPAPKGKYEVEISIKSAVGLSFLMRRYNLADLFAGKLSAILTREKMEGTIRIERFKGRDYYDLIWFGEKKVKPNWRTVIKMTGLTKKEALVKLKKKIKAVSIGALKADLEPFFENQVFVEQFAKNFRNLAETSVDWLLGGEAKTE